MSKKYQSCLQQQKVNKKERQKKIENSTNWIDLTTQLIKMLEQKKRGRRK